MDFHFHGNNKLPLIAGFSAIAQKDTKSVNSNFHENNERVRMNKKRMTKREREFTIHTFYT